MVIFSQKYKLWLVKSEFYTLNYKINSKIFKFKFF